MKALLGVLLFGVMVLSNARCTINHRSDGLVCTTTPDCTNGKACVNGYCVGELVVDAASSDARRDAAPADAKACPSRCDSCDAGSNTCTITCTGNNCRNRVVCPTGWNCNITCGADGSCRQGVQCSGAQNCNITCSATGSCDGIVCGNGKCDVMCSGAGSCGSVDCNNACACDVSCDGQGSCLGNTNCPGQGNRCSLPNGCTSAPAQCNTCP